MSRYERFDRSQVELWDLAKRGHDLRAEDCLPPVPPEKPFGHADFGHFVGRIVAARHAGRPVILMMGRSRSGSDCRAFSSTSSSATGSRTWPPTGRA